MPIALFLLASLPSSSPAGMRIVNGLTTQDHPTTGALLHASAAIDGNNARLRCSGTLIGCETFLTAAHCVTGDTAANHYLVYLQNGGLFAVTSVAYNPAYNSGQASGDDVAIVKLASPVTGIAPSVFNASHDLQAIGAGLAGTIVGFGETSGSANDYAIKRAGEVVTSACNTSLTAGEGDDVIVCFDYAVPIGAPGTDSDTCYGDSGGPLFVDFSGTSEVVGVTSTGSSSSCSAPDHAWDSSVFHNAAWIASQLGSDSSVTCGGLSAVGYPSVLVQKDSGSLSVANLDDSITVTLPEIPGLLRFTLNSTDNGSFNPNFFVKQGPGASPASYDCKADGASIFAACEFANPASTDWSIFVERAAGAGQYQITTTAFPATAPICGNDIAEAGEECDGAADAACPGLCADDCTCLACGNNAIDAGEQCDGALDDACPDQCEGDCTCPALVCSVGDLQGLSLVSDTRRFSWKAQLLDPDGSYASLDPRNAIFTLEIRDGGGLATIAVAPLDDGWRNALALHRRFTWKGSAADGGLLRAKLAYRDGTATPYWLIRLKGRAVPGAETIDPSTVLDYRVSIDDTCHLESH